MRKDNILYQDSSSVKSGRYTFLIESFEKHWEGHDSGKMEDMPGNFLDQNVSLTGCDDPTNLEALAVEMKVVLHKFNKETTNEPPGYAALKHVQLVQAAEKAPNYYSQNIRKAVKESL